MWLFIYTKKKGGEKMENTKKLENYSDVLTLAEIAEFLRISKDSAKVLVKMGVLKCLRIGRLYRFRKEDVLEFLENYGKKEDK